MQRPYGRTSRDGLHLGLPYRRNRDGQIAERSRSRVVAVGEEGEEEEGGGAV